MPRVGLGIILCPFTSLLWATPVSCWRGGEPQSLESTRSNIAFWVQFCVLWPDRCVALAPDTGKRLVQMLFVNRLQMWAVWGELRLDHGCPSVLPSRHVAVVCHPSGCIRVSIE